MWLKYKSSLILTNYEKGKKKTIAAVETLYKINPDVIFESHDYNIATLKNFENFIETLKTGSLKKEKVDLVLGKIIFSIYQRLIV